MIYFPLCVRASGRTFVLAFVCLRACLCKQICQSQVRCGFAEKSSCDLKGDREGEGEEGDEGGGRGALRAWR